MFAQSDLLALAELLAPKTAPPEPQHDVDVANLTCPTPASMPSGVKVAAARGRSDMQRAAPPEQPPPLQDEEADDGREVPEHEFCYRQQVTTSDNFLSSLTGKDPSIACCEHLVVVVPLPQCNAVAELQLDTSPTTLTLTSPHYKLRLHLPHRVDDERGSAKWDAKRRTLRVTLPVVRELLGT